MQGKDQVISTLRDIFTTAQLWNRDINEVVSEEQLYDDSRAAYERVAELVNVAQDTLSSDDESLASDINSLRIALKAVVQVKRILADGGDVDAADLVTVAEMNDTKSSIEKTYL